MPGDFNNTESSILDDIYGKDTPASDDGSGSQAEEDPQEDSQGDEANDANAPEAEEGEGEEGDKGVGKAGKPAGQGDKGAKGGKTDDKGRLIDKKTKQPVNDGLERRLYAEAHQAKQDAQRWKGEYEKAALQLSTLNKSLETINNYRLPPEELSQAAQMADLYKRDPVEAIAAMIVDAKEKGVDLSKLSLQSIDTKAISALIQKEVGDRLTPLTKEREQRDADAQALSNATAELDDFLGRNPQAEPHLEAIASLMQQVPDLSIKEAWLEIREYAARRGIDLSKPPGTESNGGAQRTRKPIPSGGRQIVNGSGNGAQPSTERKNAPAPVGTSLDDIIRESMREAGFKQ